MIEFDPEITESKALKRLVQNARAARFAIPSMSEVFPGRSYEELCKIAEDWKRQGLGDPMYGVDNGKKDVSFIIEKRAIEVVGQMETKTIKGRLSSFTRSDWMSLAALIVSAIALFKPGS